MEERKGGWKESTLATYRSIAEKHILPELGTTPVAALDGELYKRYFSINYEPAISKDEKAWLEEHGAIRMGFLNGDLGVSTMDLSSGKFLSLIHI
mgnify:CR=1 FL=1